MKYTPVKGIKLYVDDYSVNQIFVNLIENAIKYTEEGEVRVSIEKKNKKCAVNISDTE